MWKDGYWTGKMIDGYPETYFENDRFEYPWQKKTSLPKIKRPMNDGEAEQHATKFCDNFEKSLTLK